MENYQAETDIINPIFIITWQRWRMRKKIAYTSMQTQKADSYRWNISYEICLEITSILFKKQFSISDVRHF